MGQKSSTSATDGILMSNSESNSKQDEATAQEEQREKCPVLCPAYREIVLECYDKAHGDTAGRIVMRMAQQRDDFRAFMDSLSSEQREILIENLRNYLNAVVQNIDDADRVKELSANYGAFHVRWRMNGFKPDFFAITADAIATECVFLGGTATATAPTSTFKAWTLLVGTMFSAIRDGYYAELRRQRKSPAFTCGSVESIPSSDQCSDTSATFQNGLNKDKVATSYENETRHCSDTHFVSCAPIRPPLPNRERRSGSPHTTIDGKFADSSMHSVSNESHTTTPSLHREDAFYRKLPKPYKRSKSAIIDDSERNKQPSKDIVDYGAQKDRIKKWTGGPSREVPSSAALPSSDGNSPTVGRYQKNVTADYDMKRRHRIDEIVRRHDLHRFVNSNQKSASVTNLFNPNKIMDDFMNDRLN